MTVVAFTSLKGAPGVTTTACLIGAVWPVAPGAVVAECDPSGGDLAARFSLPSTRGWPTFATAVRRGGADAPVEPHLQQIPGGLEVLLGSRSTLVGDSDRSPSALLCDSWGSGARGDLLVDLGRIHPDTCLPEGWLARANLVAVVIRGDAASVLRAQELAGFLRDRCGDRLALIVVRHGSYPIEEVERFLDLPVLGELPFDPAAAAVASGERGGARRLARSPLVAAARRLAVSLVERTTPAVVETVGNGGRATEPSGLFSHAAEPSALAGPTAEPSALAGPTAEPSALAGPTAEPTEREGSEVLS